MGFQNEACAWLQAEPGSPVKEVCRQFVVTEDTLQVLGLLRVLRDDPEAKQHATLVPRNPRIVPRRHQ
jgi:hypothetical protein